MDIINVEFDAPKVNIAKIADGTNSKDGIWTVVDGFLTSIESQGRARRTCEVVKYAIGDTAFDLVEVTDANITEINILSRSIANKMFSHDVRKKYPELYPAKVGGGKTKQIAAELI